MNRVFLVLILSFFNGDGVYQFNDPFSGQCQDAEGMLLKIAFADMIKPIIHNVQFIGVRILVYLYEFMLQRMTKGL